MRSLIGPTVCVEDSTIAIGGVRTLPILAWLVFCWFEKGPASPSPANKRPVVSSSPSVPTFSSTPVKQGVYTTVRLVLSAFIMYAVSVQLMLAMPFLRVESCLGNLGNDFIHGVVDKLFSESSKHIFLLIVESRSQSS